MHGRKSCWEMMSEAMLKKARSQPDKEYDFFRYLVRHFAYYHCESITPMPPNKFTGVIPISSLSNLYDTINYIYSEWVGRVKVPII